MSVEAPSLGDFEEALAAVRVLIVRHMLALPPEISVQMPNVLRCLTFGKVALQSAIVVWRCVLCGTETVTRVPGRLAADSSDSPCVQVKCATCGVVQPLWLHEEVKT